MPAQYYRLPFTLKNGLRAHFFIVIAITIHPIEKNHNRNQRNKL